MTLTCRTCEAEFPRKSDRGKTPLYCSSQCRTRWHYANNRGAAITRARRWRAAHPESTAVDAERRRRSVFNVSPQRFAAMVEAQGDACAICRQPATMKSRGWQIDHDHRCCPGNYSCGECVRGLLCSACNRAIGWMQDDPDIVDRAAAYLRAANTRGVR